MIALLPTSYLPPRCYFSILKQHSQVQIEINETFPKQTIRNRTFIISANGLLKLSIPVASRKNASLTKDIKIDYSENWIKQHIRALESAYNSSAFFLYYKDDLFSILNNKETYLIDLNQLLTEWLCKKLKFNSSIQYTSDFQTSYQNNGDIIDLRTQLSYKQYNTCNLPNVNYSKYYQLFNNRFEFHNNLSILDLLFNEGNNAINFL